VGVSRTRRFGAGAYRRRVPRGQERTFLLESYVPRLDGALAVAISERLSAVVAQLRAQGAHLHWIRSFALEDEETYFCLLAAVDPHVVELVGERAGLACDHVAEVAVIESGISGSNARRED
jgi:hypothetical protein